MTRGGNLPMTFDLRFLPGFIGVVFFDAAFASFCDDADDCGGFPPKKERMSIAGGTCESSQSRR
jgi:hypothetical protein